MGKFESVEIIQGGEGGLTSKIGDNTVCYQGGVVLVANLPRDTRKLHDAWSELQELLVIIWQ